MKKHELLKHAYDNYPKGVRFTWGGETIISTGVFRFKGDKILNAINENSEEKYEFDLYDPKMSKKWAEIIEQPKSILDGKVAVIFSNQRELDLLCKHFNIKTNATFSYIKVNYPNGIECFNVINSVKLNRLSFDNDETMRRNGYTIIPFSEFAAEAGIEVSNEQKGTRVDLYFGQSAEIIDDNSEIILYNEGGIITTISTGDIYDLYAKLKGGDNAQS